MPVEDVFRITGRGAGKSGGGDLRTRPPIQVPGTGERFDGKYYVTGDTHSLGGGSEGGGYSTLFKVKRSADGWARIVTPMKGSNRGTYGLREAGDEVLVGFEHGNMVHP